MIVVDASVIASAVADDGLDGRLARQRLSGEHLYAPELIDLEVVSVIRKALAAGGLTEKRALEAFTDFLAIPIERAGHTATLARVYELRSNLTPYDAAYVALAELIDAPLVTGDAALARAPGVRSVIEILPTRSTIG